MEDRTAPHVGDRYVPTKMAWRTSVGPVWIARDQVLGRQVFILLVESKDAEVRSRFRATASALARVTDPGVAQVYDVGSDPPFAVFENPGGGRLSDRMRAGPLPAADAARIALGLARALEALHRAGLHHGALRPDIVLLDAEGRAKILALDVAGDVDQPPGYRAPRAPTPQAADAYALAALTWHLVAGRAPQQPLPRRGGGDLDAVLRRALDPDPSKRPSLDAFIGQLGPYARVTPAKARSSSGRALEFRWLLPAAIIFALAILAATVGVDIAKDLADKTRPQPTATPSSRPTVAPLEIAEVSDFDPEGDRRESAQLVELAHDGDLSTSWRTERYERAGLGGKNGVGLLVDLGDEVAVSRIQLRTDLAGWSGEIHLSTDPIRRVGEATRAGVFTAKENTIVPFPAETTARYVVIWITQLVDAGDGRDPPYIAPIAEIRIFAP